MSPQTAFPSFKSRAGALIFGLIILLFAPAWAAAQSQPDRAVEEITPLVVDDADSIAIAPEPGRGCIQLGQLTRTKAQQPYALCGGNQVFIIYQAGNTFLHASIEGERKRLAIGTKAAFDLGCSLFFLTYEADTYLLRIDCG